jgi:hypothetical protein
LRHHRLELPVFEHRQETLERGDLVLQVLELLWAVDLAAIEPPLGLADLVLLRLHLTFCGEEHAARLLKRGLRSIHPRAGFLYFGRDAQHSFDLSQALVRVIQFTVEQLQTIEVRNATHRQGL